MTEMSFLCVSYPLNLRPMASGLVSPVCWLSLEVKQGQAGKLDQFSQDVRPSKTS